MKVLVTGITGFIGRALCDFLAVRDEYDVVATSRNTGSTNDNAIPVISTGDFATFANWESALSGIDVVVHTVGRAHVMNDTVSNPLNEYLRVNTEGTLRLAEAAVASGVKRFIFLSSIKVNGESTQEGSPFLPDQVGFPEDPYGVSKFEAEQKLLKLAENSDMEIVIIRLPLVYGPEVKGNFSLLMKLVSARLPLPVGAITTNRRSMIYVENLNDFIQHCIVHPNAANQIFLVSDDEDISTSGLVQKISSGLNIRSWLIPVPVSVMECCSRLIGKTGVYQRLCGSLQVDLGKAKNVLGWSPPYSVDEGIQHTVAYYKSNRISLVKNKLRVVDLFLSMIGLAILWPLLLVITIFGLFDTGSPFFLQERVGRGKKPFTLIKFRTMKKNTKSVASHLVSASSITPLGKFLRKSKLDELPQLINVVRGEMSLVGPRPNLFNQKELMREREIRGIYDVLPGITGLAQINKIDMSTPKYLAEIDSKMIRCLTIRNYFKYIIKTAFGKGTGDVVR